MFRGPTRRFRTARAPRRTASEAPNDTPRGLNASHKSHIEPPRAQRVPKRSSTRTRISGCLGPRGTPTSYPHPDRLAKGDGLAAAIERRGRLTVGGSSGARSRATSFCWPRSPMNWQGAVTGAGSGAGGRSPRRRLRRSISPAQICAASPQPTRRARHGATRRRRRRGD